MQQLGRADRQRVSCFNTLVNSVIEKPGFFVAETPKEKSHAGISVGSVRMAQDKSPRLDNLSITYGVTAVEKMKVEWDSKIPLKRGST